MTLKRIIRPASVDKHYAYTRFETKDEPTLRSRTGNTRTSGRLDVRRTGRDDGADLQMECTINVYHTRSATLRSMHHSICSDAATAVDLAAAIAPELWAVIDTLIYGADRTPDHLQTAIDQALVAVALRKQAEATGSVL